MGVPRAEMDDGEKDGAVERPVRRPIHTVDPVLESLVHLTPPKDSTAPGRPGRLGTPTLAVRPAHRNGARTTIMYLR